MTGIVSIILLVATALPAAAPAGPDRSYGRVELIRDKWGIPHAFSDTDAGAMYALGYAAAEERGFQMHYSLRIIQGRLAELVGDVRKLRRRETAVHNDRMMRTFGFYRAARRVAGGLDAGTGGLLEAYCKGVNDYFAAHRDELHPLFGKLGLDPEPWTPADCIVSWWHLGQFFATDGTRDLLHWRNVTGRGAGGRGPTRTAPQPGPLWVDDSAAVVQRSDVPEDWVRRTERFLRDHGLVRQAPAASAPAGPKFSHAWVVAGKKTTTGAAVLVSDPQTPVRNPSLWHEFHVSGKTFNARGIGVPGSPGILIGFNEHVAWGVTALGADQADLFRLRTDPNRPDQYHCDGQWRPMEVLRETVRVKGGRAVPVVIRLTHFGPVVTPFAFAGRGDPEVALKRVPICSPAGETIQALLAMARASSARRFAEALAGWHFPSCNIIFGDDRGDIGYWLLAAVPIRSPLATHGGRAAMDGTDPRCDWRGWVPHDLKPHVINPARGWIASGNHRPIESFYRIPLGISTGSGGHSVRSWRLYERLRAKDRFRPQDVLHIHYDCTNPARREIVRIGYHLRDVLKRRLSPEAVLALKHLEAWYSSGARSDLNVPGAETATALGTFFRFVATPLAGKYGGGESGLARFLTHAGSRIDKDPAADIAADEARFVDNALATAWRTSRQVLGRDPAAWPELARKNVQRRRMGWFEGLDGFGSLDPAGDLAYPALSCVDGGTIRSQAGQSYTQFVPLGNVDAAMSIQPIGHSDRADGASRTSTMKLWETGKLHPAGLSREATEKVAASRRILSR